MAWRVVCNKLLTISYMYIEHDQTTRDLILSWGIMSPYPSQSVSALAWQLGPIRTATGRYKVGYKNTHMIIYSTTSNTMVKELLTHNIFWKCVNLQDMFDLQHNICLIVCILSLCMVNIKYNISYIKHNNIFECLVYGKPPNHANHIHVYTLHNTRSAY